MIYNKILKIVFTVFVGGVMTGCSDWLDIRPDGEIVLEDFWQTEAQVEGVVATCYKSLTEDGNLSRIVLWGELRGDNVESGLSSGGNNVLGGINGNAITRVLDVDIDYQNAVVDWGYMYTMINYCNTFLEYAPDVIDIDPNFTQVKYNILEGEVRALRALAYFYLVRTYKEVPYITDASIDDNQEYSMAKSTEDYLIAKILEDLKAAEASVRNKFDITAENKGRITKNAVKAIMADVYLWNEDYDLCVMKCDEIMQDSSLQLLSGKDVYFNQLFYRKNSKESIFELQCAENNNVNNATKLFYGSSSSSTRELGVPEFIIKGEYSPFSYKVGNAVESEEDVRRYDNIQSGSSGVHKIFKYTGIISRAIDDIEDNDYTQVSTSANWIVYRLADIILMKAEAKAQISRRYSSNEESETRNKLYNEIISLVNQTYSRANMDADTLIVSNYNTIGEIDKLILRERQRELMFEGKRWFDLMRVGRRNNDPQSVIQYVAPKFTKDPTMQSSKMSVMDALYLPVPEKDMKNNPLMVQNPFYVTSSSTTVN